MGQNTTSPQGRACHSANQKETCAVVGMAIHRDERDVRMVEKVKKQSWAES